MLQPRDIDVQELARALFVVNKHAKTAPDPKYLYQLKKEAIKKLIEEQAATKIGLHFSDHPKFSHQHSTLLVQIADYYFHIPPSKDDFKTLKHLGKLDQSYRNPKTHMSLSHAKKLLANYLGWPLEKPRPTHHRSTYYTPSSLGKMDSPFKSKRYKR
ncbi:YkyB family protein [Radiobacillus deserti]|uniref:YkyB-like protein n=1 Tax=Radiobacillus deserti TaxID=2594883 RepID=A0A516KFC1_9BACI|nr:YkyB family protein [Radiobacillus deserti]QDP40026.1 hypothetical protein FN924_07500 [Radiobacillus deserti]